MTNKYTLQDCIDLATFAHRHQRDKAGEPYINHPLRVLQSVQAQGAQAYVQMAAVLHDVTEDTPFTPDMLVAFGVPEAAVEIVKLLDRGHSLEKWKVMDPIAPVNKAMADEYYYGQIKTSPGALIVKKADIGDNTQPWRLEYLPQATQDRLRKKYADALDYLTGQ